MSETTNSVYLHRDDIETLKQLFAELPDQHTVEITSDTSSGIGSVIEATFHGVKVFGKPSKVTFTIADEENW